MGDFPGEGRWGAWRTFLGVVVVIAALAGSISIARGAAASRRGGSRRPGGLAAVVRRCFGLGERSKDILRCERSLTTPVMPPRCALWPNG